MTDVEIRNDMVAACERPGAGGLNRGTSGNVSVRHGERITPTAVGYDAIAPEMMGRNGCLMANHSMVVGGPDLTRALWLAGELEALAHQHYHALAIGGGHILSDAQIAKGFESYGVRKRKTA